MHHKNDNSCLLRRAKEQLAGQWGNAASASLIYIVIIAAASSIYIGELVLLLVADIRLILFWHV